MTEVQLRRRFRHSVDPRLIFGKEMFLFVCLFIVAVSFPFLSLSTKYLVKTNYRDIWMDGKEMRGIRYRILSNRRCSIRWVWRVVIFYQDSKPTRLLFLEKFRKFLQENMMTIMVSPINIKYFWFWCILEYFTLGLFCNLKGMHFLIQTASTVQRMCGTSYHVFLSSTGASSPLALGAVGSREGFAYKK